MKRNVLILLVLFFLFPLNAYSFPQFIDIFNKDPLARPEKKNKCSVCHISPSGGGPLNDFGMAFDANGHKITNNIRQQFPELFDLLKALEPKIIRVKPAAFIAGQELHFMILGKNFANDSTVKIDGNEIKDIPEAILTFVGSKKINLTITFNDTGVHTIQIVNATGQTSNVFKIKAKPTK